MNMRVEFFSAYTNAKIEVSDVYLPMNQAATADLISLLPNNSDYIYLTLKGDVQYETVKARNEYGTIIIDRAQEGTEAALHPYGTCVFSVPPTQVAVMKDLICNYSCCGDNECPCVPVAYSGAVLPTGLVNKPWSGSVVFAGDLPIKAGVSGLPDWMRANAQGNMVKLEGTPTNAGEFTISVAGSNCNGTAIVTQSLKVLVQV